MDDAVEKLEKLGVVSRVRFLPILIDILIKFPVIISNTFYDLNCQDSIGRHFAVSLKRANEIIGTTTEELVMKARQTGLQ